MDKETLAHRKEMLLARSSLYRLALARDALAARESLTVRNLVSSAAGSAPWRPLALGATMLVLGRSKVGGVLGIATRVLGIVKAFRGRRKRR